MVWELLLSFRHKLGTLQTRSTRTALCIWAVEKGYKSSCEGGGNTVSSAGGGGGGGGGGCSGGGGSLGGVSSLYHQQSLSRRKSIAKQVT